MSYISVKGKLNICTDRQVLPLVQVHGIYNNDGVLAAGGCMEMYRASHHLGYLNDSVDAALVVCQQCDMLRSHAKGDFLRFHLFCFQTFLLLSRKGNLDSLMPVS